LEPWQVILTAGVMRTFPEFEKRTFRELIYLAPEYLEEGKNALFTYHEKARHEDFQNQQRLSYDETAKLVTGNKRLRDAKKNFAQFLAYVERCEATTEGWDIRLHWAIDSGGQISPNEPVSWPLGTIPWMRNYYQKRNETIRKKA
jgi:hypothetical protein